MQALSIGGTNGGIDWASLGWGALLALITMTCLWILRRFPDIVRSGAGAQVLAHVAIGYFGIGMIAYGVSSAAARSLAVPGGIAWEGSVAVIGGLAACVIGGTTLAEHALQIVAMRRAEHPLAAAGASLAPSLVQPSAQTSAQPSRAGTEAR